MRQKSKEVGAMAATGLLAVIFVILAVIVQIAFYVAIFGAIAWVVFTAFKAVFG